MKKSISANFPEMNFYSTDRVIVFEKIINLLTTKKGTHHEDPNYGSVLFNYIDKAIHSHTEEMLQVSISRNLKEFLPEYVDDIKVDIQPLADKGFSIRIIYKDNFITLESVNDLFKQ